MRKVSLALLLAAGLAVTASAQPRPPQLLMGAAHCLAAKEFLPPSKAATLSFGYFLDEESYPGDKVVYVINYAAPARTNGLVFAVFLTERDGRQNFNIQNDASFALSSEEHGGVSFTSPPLGGTWTQEHLAAAIHRIEKRPRFAIPVGDLLAAGPGSVCESYTDPQEESPKEEVK